MRKAFTFMELIFVIVIAGILLAVAIPRLSTVDELQIATDQVIGHIRYAQSTALANDRYDSARKTEWYKYASQVAFHSNIGSKGKLAYSVFIDKGGDNRSGAGNRNPNEGEILLNPLDSSLLLSGGFDNINEDWCKKAPNRSCIDKSLCLECTYNIISIATTFPNNSQRIGFDELGRPFTGFAGSGLRYLEKRGVITLTHKSGDKMSICIEPETGYTHRCD